MIRQFVLALAALLTVGFTPKSDTPRDPIGERAPYQLDKNGSRTTGLIQSGSALATVSSFLPDHEQGPSYNVSLDYDFVVQFYGRQHGTAEWAFPQEFFTPEFMTNLRQTGNYQTPDYKIRHEGYADARNMDGSVYPHCDKILIYDINIPDSQMLRSLLYAAAGLDPSRRDNPRIENLQIRAHMYAGVPVLSAVKLDLSGIVEGMSVKAGFDYKR